MTTPDQIATLTSNTATRVDAEWVDIIGPAMPADMLPWWWLVIAVAIMSSLLLILYIWLRQPRFAARVKLTLLRSKLKRDTASDYRATALTIARVTGMLLRPDFRYTARTEAVKSFCEQLDHACYSPANVTKTEILSLLDTALTLLKREGLARHTGTLKVLS